MIEQNVEQNVEQYGVEVGQIWRSLDRRDVNRIVRVVGIQDAWAEVENINTQKKTKVRLDRFRENSKGWTRAYAAISERVEETER